MSISESHRMFLSYFRSIWCSYHSYLTATIQFASNDSVRNIDYWQEKLFITGVLYALPLTLLALIPCVYFEFGSLGSTYRAAFEIISAVAFAFFVLAPGLPLKLRKLIVILLIALVSVAQFIFFREFSMGCIYLFSLSALVALLYSNKVAFITVAFNFLVLASFALAIRYHLFNLNIIINVPFDRWVIYSSNFILTNLIVVALIRQILNGLARTMQKEAWLFDKLQKEVEQTAYLNHDLKNSKEEYKMLFFQSPLPKLIYDIDTLKFLQVNIAATKVYGYSKEEFLGMNLTNIYPKDCTENMLYQITHENTSEPLAPHITQHLGKDGKQIHTELRQNNTTFKGKKARMIITTDITQNVEFTDAIQLQNQKLTEIAYIQSHVIRLPLARIMSICELIDLEYSNQIDAELLKFLNVSTLELDAVIREVVSKSEEVLSYKVTDNFDN